MRFNLSEVFNLSSLHGVNWFEGFRRLKVVLQWGSSAFVFLIGLSDFSRSYGGFYGFCAAIVVAGLVFFGVEVVFRIVIWVIKGFLDQK